MAAKICCLGSRNLIIAVFAVFAVFTVFTVFDSVKIVKTAKEAKTEQNCKNKRNINLVSDNSIGTAQFEYCDSDRFWAFAYNRDSSDELDPCKTWKLRSAKTYDAFDIGAVSSFFFGMVKKLLVDRKPKNMTVIIIR